MDGLGEKKDRGQAERRAKRMVKLTCGVDEGSVELLGQ